MYLATILVIAVQAAQLVAAQGAPTVKWTLHSSCCKLRAPARTTLTREIDQDANLRKKMLSSMETVKSRSARAAKINSFIDRSLVQAVSVICPKTKLDAVASECDSVFFFFGTILTRADRFKLQSGLEGPIGKPASDSQVVGVYANSREWLDLASKPNNYKNFVRRPAADAQALLTQQVIYCAPNVEPADEPVGGNKLYYIRAESKKGLYGNPLTILYEDMEAKKFRPPEKQILAVTSQYDKYLDDDLKLNPETDLAKVPEGITFNKVYLDETHAQYGGYDVVTKALVDRMAGPDGPRVAKEKIEELIKANPAMNEAKKTELRKQTPFDVLLNAIDGTLHHEVRVN